MNLMRRKHSKSVRTTPTIPSQNIAKQELCPACLNIQLSSKHPLAPNIKALRQSARTCPSCRLALESLRFSTARLVDESIELTYNNTTLHRSSVSVILNGTEEVESSWLCLYAERGVYGVPTITKFPLSAYLLDLEESRSAAI